MKESSSFISTTHHFSFMPQSFLLPEMYPDIDSKTETCSFVPSTSLLESDLIQTSESKTYAPVATVGTAQLLDMVYSDTKMEPATEVRSAREYEDVVWLSERSRTSSIRLSRSSFNRLKKMYNGTTFLKSIAYPFYNVVLYSCSEIRKF